MKLANLYYQSYDFPLGKLYLFANDKALVRIEFSQGDLELPKKSSKHSGVLAAAQTQLDAYFASSGKPFKFDLPIEIDGTAFQVRFWQTLVSVPYGKTSTYGELAKQLNSSARAIGGACRRNPIPIIVPCHRVVAQNHIGGFNGAVSGSYLKIKEFLLNLEIAVL